MLISKQPDKTEFTYDTCPDSLLIRLNLFSAPGLQGQEESKEIQTFLSFATSANPSRGETNTFPSQPRYNNLSSMSLVCPGLSIWVNMADLTQETSRRHSAQMLEQHKLVSLNMEEQWLYSEPLPATLRTKLISDICIAMSFFRSLPRALDHR